MAYVQPYTCGGALCKFDLNVDDAEPWYTGTGNPSPTQRDLWSVLTHEFGHATGLGETNLSCSGSSRPTMCLAPLGTTYIRILEADDKNGLNANYP